MEKKADFQPQWVEKYHMRTSVLSDCVERWDYLYQMEKGSIYICSLWPGVAVWANMVFMGELPCETTATNYSFVKLNYCIDGRCEVLLENGKYVYLSAGMLSIDCNQPKEQFYYPTRYYEGLEIVINLEEIRKHSVTIFEELGIGSESMERLRHHDQGSYIAGVSEEWDRLANTLIKRLKTADGKVEDFRFYVLQLLYMLGAGHSVPQKSVYITKGQRRIASETERRICQNLKAVLTVEQLAQEAGVSPSSLKKYFRMIFGCSISEYIREKRMEYACRLLKETDMSVGEIAEQAGYAHQGKFGGVFKAHTGSTPLEYRRRNRSWNRERENGGKDNDRADTAENGM